MIKEFKKKGISLDDTYQSDEDGNRSTPQFHENEFVILKTDQSSKKTLLGRVSGGRVVPLVYKKANHMEFHREMTGSILCRKHL